MTSARNHRVIPPPREVLRLLAREAHSGIIDVPRAAKVLQVSPKAAATLLGRYARRGWLSRLRPGLYLILPLESGPTTTAAVEDPWVLAVELFAPCYVGGWTAVEHWGFTEQLFRSTFVVSSRSVRSTELRVGASEFRVARVRRSRLVGTTSVWRGSTRVPVSDPERTIVDALIDPTWVGGIRHLADALLAYHESPRRDLRKLARTLEHLGRGAAIKRMGFLAERLWPAEKDLIAVAIEHRSTGVIKLDPSVKTRGRLDKRWGLWVNTTVGETAAG